MVAHRSDGDTTMNVSNLPLADRYAAAKGALDAAQKAVDALKAEIKETGVARLEGAFYVVEVGLSERASLDTKLVKAILTDEQSTACTKVTTVETIRIKPMAAVGK